MYAFFEQLLTLIRDDQLQFYLIAFAFSFAIWLTRLLFLATHKDYSDKFKGKFAVFMPVFNEDPELFERSLKSIAATKPAQFIVTFDGKSVEHTNLEKIAKKYADITEIQAKRTGKRGQFVRATELLSKKVDVIITVDSDSVWTDSTLNILSPFNDEEVGGVVGRQEVYDRTASTTRRFADWLEDLRYKFVMPMQSRFGNVLVMPGRTLAVRAELYKDAVTATANEKILGRQMFSGDDGAITMEILKAGFKTVYQSNSVTETNAPDSLRKIAKQYLRWYRNGYRRFFTRLPQFTKINPLVSLSWFSHLFGGIIFSGLVVSFIAKLGFGLYEILPVQDLLSLGSSAFWVIVVFLISSLLTRALRQTPHFASYAADIIYLPLFALFALFVLAPVKLFAMFSFFESSWLTRSKKDDPAHVATRRSRIVSVATGIALFAVIAPSVLAYDIGRLGIPTSELFAGNGPEYYLAAQQTETFAANDTGSAVLSATDTRILDGINENDDTTVDARAYTFIVDCVSNSVQANDVARDNPLQLYEACAENDYTSQIAAAEAAETLAAAERAEQAQGSVAGTTSAEAGDSSDSTSSDTSSGNGFSLTAAAGDSQTSLVRAAINADDRFNDLSAEQKLFVETTLVDAIGRENKIAIGSTFTLSASSIESASSQARELTATELAHWRVLCI